MATSKEINIAAAKDCCFEGSVIEVVLPTVITPLSQIWVHISHSPTSIMLLLLVAHFPLRPLHLCSLTLAKNFRGNEYCSRMSANVHLH